MGVEKIDAIAIEDYVKVICAVLDVPVGNTKEGNSMIQSLHLIFEVYSAFRNSQHFN